MKKLLFFLLITLIGTQTKAQNRIVDFDSVGYPETIVIDIQSDTINNTILHKTATLFTMIYNQGNKSLSLTWTVKHYADSLGKKGKYIGDIAPDYSITSTADNDVKVTFPDGVIIEGEPTVDWVGQYDYFNYAARKAPILVHNMIKQYGAGVSNWKKRN